MARIKITLGNTEIEYEGDDKFIADGLLKLVKELKEAIPEAGADDRAGGAVRRKRDASVLADDLSTSTIAQMLSSKTGSDLAKAASAHLGIVKNKEKFSRQEILDEMKGARSFYKSSYSGNLTKSLKTLVKEGRLNESGNDEYALAQPERTALENKLANR